MNNVTLGKVLKAMYKLSGKTLMQLSDETDLTVDNINNLFYARIQKPGLAGVNALVNAMGFSIQQLMTFMTEHPELPENCDVTELFTTTVAAAEDTNASAAPAKGPVKAAKADVPSEIELLNAEHEKQLDRFRATHQRYVEQLQQQHDKQIRQLQEHETQMEQHFDKSVLSLKEAHTQEIARLEKENARQRGVSRFLTVAVSILTGVLILLLLLDVLNRNVGWLR